MNSSISSCLPVWTGRLAPFWDSALHRRLNRSYKLDRLVRGWFVVCAKKLRDESAPSCSAVDQADWQDIQASLAGSNDAYARLIERYQATIGAQMWRFTRSRSVFEELVHNVFVEAFLSLNRFQGRAPFVHWLRKIAVRVGYRHWKAEAKRRNQTIHGLDQALMAAPAENSRAASERVHEVLLRLSPRDRLVVTLMHLEQHSVAKTAHLLGWSEAMVKVQAFRARRKLKKLLQETL